MSVKIQPIKSKDSFKFNNSSLLYAKYFHSIISSLLVNIFEIKRIKTQYNCMKGYYSLFSSFRAVENSCNFAEFFLNDIQIRHLPIFDIIFSIFSIILFIKINHYIGMIFFSL